MTDDDKKANYNEVVGPGVVTIIVDEHLELQSIKRTRFVTKQELEAMTQIDRKDDGDKILFNTQAAWSKTRKSYECYKLPKEVYNKIVQKFGGVYAKLDDLYYVRYKQQLYEYRVPCEQDLEELSKAYQKYALKNLNDYVQDSDQPKTKQP